MIHLNINSSKTRTDHKVILFKYNRIKVNNIKCDNKFQKDIETNIKYSIQH